MLNKKHILIFTLIAAAIFTLPACSKGTDTKAPASAATQSSNIEATDMPDDKAINVVWSHVYYWAMGSDYVYIDSDGKIYSEGEVENPTWSPSGACNETYSGKQLTEEEFNELLSIDEEDEESQKEMFRKMGIKFGEKPWMSRK